MIKLTTLLLMLSLASASFANSKCENLFEKHCRLLYTCPPETIIDKVVSWMSYRKEKDQWAINARRENIKTLQTLNRVPFEKDSASRRGSLSKSEIERLFKAVTDHPVASLENYEKYDPKNTGVGFCFGRATAAHFEALWNFNLSQKSIRKVFAVGNLKSDDVNWRYHVTTIVRRDDGQWIAIDPIFERPMAVEKWFEQLRDNLDKDKTMMIFDTPAKRFGPSSTSPAYRLSDLTRETYNGFFVDLLDSYREKRDAQQDDYKNADTDEP